MNDLASYSSTTNYTDWWNQDREDAFRSIESITNSIEDDQRARKQNHERALRLYGQEYKIGDPRITHIYTEGRQLLALNIVRNIINTVQAEICQNRPRPTFLTKRGDWALQRRAKKLEQYVEGDFYLSNVYDTSPEVFRDACLFDGGVSKVYYPDPEDAAIVDERVYPWELLVPDGGALYNDPRHLYHQKFVDRSIMADLYPKYADEIEQANRHTTYTSSAWTQGTSSDLILVTEGWRLPNRKGAGGKHAIVIENATLVFDDWSFDWFPFDVLRWSRNPVGFWGDSLANQLVGLQYELNLTMKKIQQAHHLLGRSHILWPKGCGVPKSHANNQEACIWEYEPKVGAPQVINVAPVHPQVYQWVETIYQKAHEIVGVSQSAAQNQIPAGITGSGKAQLVYEAMQSKRFVLAGQAYETYHMDKAKKHLELRKRLAEQRPELEQKVEWSGKRNGRGFVESIDWKDAYVDGYVMKVFPTSQLPSTPAGKAATVEQWINAGWIGREQGMRLLEFPDLDNEMDLELASWDLTTEMIERMLYAEDPQADDVMQMPIPQMNLDLALKVCAGAYLRARLDGAPEGNLLLLLQWMDAVEQLIRQGTPPAPAPTPAAAPMNPAGMPDAGIPLGPEASAQGMM